MNVGKTHLGISFLLASVVVVSFLMAPHPAFGSYAFYVGRDLTADGSVLLGGTGEEVSSHWLEVVPRREHPKGATVQVGVTEAADIPGERITIPQVRHTHKYITMNYSDYRGFPAPLTNGGMNEHQVAARDVWAPSRKELVEMTPKPQRGPQYSDLSRIALERAETAEEAVRIVGELIDEHGYSTYGGNSHLFADPREGWVLVEYAGGEGLWAAKRLGPDTVRASYPGYIEEFPRNYRDHPDYMGSDKLIDFAVKKGWLAKDFGDSFNLHEVYGRQGVKARKPEAKLLDPAALEQELKDMAPVSLSEFMKLVRDPRIADDEAGYGQVAYLRRGVPKELALLWVAPTGSVTSPFIPYYMGIEDVPPEFKQHRYLTKGAASSFLDPRYQAQEATRFAGRVFKRLMYYTCAHPETFLPEVSESLQAFEKRLRRETARVESTARVLLGNDKAKLAREYLTDYSNARAMEGLRLGESLLASIEARTKLLYGIEGVGPKGGFMNARGGMETVNCLPERNPDQPEGS